MPKMQLLRPPSKLVSPKPKPLEVKQVIVQPTIAHHLFKGNLDRGRGTTAPPACNKGALTKGEFTKYLILMYGFPQRP